MKDLNKNNIATARVSDFAQDVPWRIHIIWLLLFALLLLVVFEGTNWDVRIETWFTDPNTHQFIYRDDPLLNKLFHTGLRNLNAILGLIAVGWFWRKAWRHPEPAVAAAYFAAGMSLLTISLLVGVLKEVTHRYCPWSLEMFGGTVPYVGLLETLPEAFRNSSDARCFPAGHASGGFMWLSPPIVLWRIQPHWARWGLIFALSMGGVMGLTQMMRGAHFLSHTLWTVWISWAFTIFWWQVGHFYQRKTKFSLRSSQR